MSVDGYYRFPTIHQDTVVFVCEDDLWSVPVAGGIARRLTSNPGQATRPSLSPDGALLAFTGRDEGHAEVYVMPAAGGTARRLTYLGSQSLVIGWQPEGRAIVFASNAAQPLARQFQLYSVDAEGGEPEQLPIGPAMSVSYGPGGGRVIGRNTTDLARWKRYRGGLTGDLWVDPDGGGDWRRLIRLAGNLALPLWVGERIYFVSDHEGIGNLYSCLPSGEELRRHTHHEEYYVRHPGTDGHRIVYHAGADLYLYDPALDKATRIEVELHSPQVQCKRKFVEAEHYVQGYSLHPEGHSVAITARGRPFSMAAWEGPVLQHGDTGSTRYRLTSWLDANRLIAVCDAGIEELLEIHAADGSAPPERLEGLPIGRPVELAVAPHGKALALSNHRNELVLVEVEARAARVLDRSRHSRIRGIAWSPDGRWIAYGFHTTQQTAGIKLCRVESGETWEVTRPVLRDVGPAFDPEGKYLYFLSYRDFDPVYDNLHFDLNFPRGMRPCLITLQAETPSPFAPSPRPPGERRAKRDSEEARRDEQPDQEPPALRIDLDGIADRVVAFPVPAARYGQIRGIRGGALFSSYPLEGALKQSWQPSPTPPAKGRIEIYDFTEQNLETLIEGITSFDVSPTGRTLIYRAGNRLRVLKAGEKPAEKGNKGEGPGRKSGWIDLGRIRVSVSPRAEWEQMYREAWRLQRDQFWVEDMSGVDWQAVYQRYLPLLARVATRSEFSDLMWEMQGELGTSHAYEFGGDYRREPEYPQGFLGADLRYDPASDGYRVVHIVRGDEWDSSAGSPLLGPGIDAREGDVLIAVGGRRLSRTVSPQQLLVHQAESDVLLTFAGRDGDAPRTFSVKTLRDETPARYREWVEANRQRVHEASAGRVGYIHIPDMGARGYAEFHRGYLAEVEREALIVDVRFNGGGHVSPLILEKLARRRLGYAVSRWGQPSPYPPESPTGVMVAITNEQAGSDGDIFSHVFKMMQLGPLIGKRTWGGVIGISARDLLVDGSLTTQPEFSFWFSDVGWRVENYGTDPTIEVDIRPQDYAEGCDPQLDRAIEEVLRALAENPPRLPDFGPRPQLLLPALRKAEG